MQRKKGCRKKVNVPPGPGEDERYFYCKLWAGHDGPCSKDWPSDSKRGKSQLAPLAKRRWQIRQRSNGIVVGEHQARGASQAWNLFMVKMGREGLNPDRCNFDVRRLDDDAPTIQRKLQYEPPPTEKERLEARAALKRLLASQRGPAGLKRRFAL